MEITDYLRFVAALAFVLGLIGLLGFLLRRYGAAAGLAIATRGREGRRLNVVEVMALDARRRLVLIRRDGVEHLLLLGAERDMVVETGIRKDAEGSDFAALVAGADAPAPSQADPKGASR